MFGQIDKKWQGSHAGNSSLGKRGTFLTNMDPASLKNLGAPDPSTKRSTF